MWVRGGSRPGGGAGAGRRLSAASAMSRANASYPFTLDNYDVYSPNDTFAHIRYKGEPSLHSGGDKQLNRLLSTRADDASPQFGIVVGASGGARPER